MRENVVKDKSFGFVTFIYWLELLQKTDNLTKDQFENMNADALKEKGVIERIGGTRGYWKILIEE